MSDDSTSSIPALICATVMLLALIGFVIGFVLPLNTAVDQLKDRTEYHSIDKFDKTFIESLEAGSTTNGYFILGSGSISGRDVYIYYTKNSNGGYIRNHINADQTIIYMDENTSPYLISQYVETNKLHVQFINSYELHVPNGAITKSFSAM